MDLAQQAIARYYAIYDRNQQELIDDFCKFLSFPSVSSELSYKQGVNDCVSWLKGYLEESGLRVEIWETGGHPTVYAENLDAGSNAPTVMIYNHYDVQPTDPLELWQSPPFQPTIYNGEIYARGAQDNKGQCFYAISAVREWLKSGERLPVNIKLVIEGEEEIASPGLRRILAERADQLKADYLFVLDVDIPGPDVPAVTLGIRGIVTINIEVIGSNSDLHSGVHGGLAYNPNRALVEILGKLRDAQGRIAVPGFADDILLPTPEEVAELDMSFDAEKLMREFGFAPSGIDLGFGPKESNWLRPTIEINGIGGGYFGDGFKTVIPARAVGKISCRLVPDQDPNKIGRLVCEFLEANAPAGVVVKAEPILGIGFPVRTSPKSTIAKIAAQSMAEVFGKPCLNIMSGVSIPIVPDLTRASKAEMVMVGLGLSTDLIHAPNERFSLQRLRQGFALVSRMIELIGKLP